MPRSESTDPEVMAAAGLALARLAEQDSRSQAELSASSGLTPSAISMIFSGQRRPAPDSLDRLASALGTTGDDVYNRAREDLRRRKVLVECERPFLAVGPFLDGLIFQAAAASAWPSEAADTQIAIVEPWRDLGTLLHTKTPPFQFAVANLDFVENPGRILPRASTLLKLTGWTLQIHPCFTLIHAHRGRPAYMTYEDLLRRRDTNDNTNPSAPFINELSTLLRGKIILVEPNTDLRANVSVLLEFLHASAPDMVTIIDEGDWRQRFDWPKLEDDEVVVVETSTAPRALELLASGLLLENVIVVGGIAQRIAAQVAGPQPNLFVPFSDTSLVHYLASIGEGRAESSRPRKPSSGGKSAIDAAREAFFEKRWRDKWYRPANGIVTNTAVVASSEERDYAARLFNDLFEHLKQLLDRPAQLAERVADDYRRYGGAGWPLKTTQLVKILTSFEIRKTDEEVAFKPIQ